MVGQLTVASVRMVMSLQDKIDIELFVMGCQYFRKGGYHDLSIPIEWGGDETPCSDWGCRLIRSATTQPDAWRVLSCNASVESSAMYRTP